MEWTRAGGRWTLRLFVDKAGGFGIDDCQVVSRIVEPILDVEDFIEPAYDLEVSSPGLERPLRKPSDFERFAGQRARIKSFGPVAGTAPDSPGRKHWTGVLQGIQGRRRRDRRRRRAHRVPHDQIAKANLEYDFEAELRRKD